MRMCEEMLEKNSPIDAKSGWYKGEIIAKSFVKVTPNFQTNNFIIQNNYIGKLYGLRTNFKKNKPNKSSHKSG